MNDQLNNQLAEALRGAQAAGKDLYGFLQAQAPDLLEQIVRWEVWSSVYGLSFGGFLILVGGVGLYALRDEEHQPIALAPILLGGFVACVNGYDLIKVLSAPKLVVLEYLQRFLSSLS